MYKFLMFFYFSQLSFGNQLPNSKTLFEEYKKVFAITDQKLLAEEIRSNSAIFNIGCNSNNEKNPLLKNCTPRDLSTRAGSLPDNTKLYHMKMVSLCYKLVDEGSNLDAFLKKFDLSDKVDASDIKRVYGYFYPLDREPHIKAEKIHANLTKIDSILHAKGLFLTFCMDTGWL